MLVGTGDGGLGVGISMISTVPKCTIFTQVTLEYSRFGRGGAMRFYDFLDDCTLSESAAHSLKMLGLSFLLNMSEQDKGPVCLRHSEGLPGL